jgi:hypothetical protein
MSAPQCATVPQQKCSPLLRWVYLAVTTHSTVDRLCEHRFILASTAQHTHWVKMSMIPKKKISSFVSDQARLSRSWAVSAACTATTTRTQRERERESGL